MSIACPTPPVDPSISKIKETARRIHSQQSLRSARVDADPHPRHWEVLAKLPGVSWDGQIKPEPMSYAYPR